MPMPESEIQPGWIYRTSHPKELLVLGRDRDGLVVYAPKGRTDAPPFHNCHVRVTLKKFAQRAMSKLRYIEDLKPYIVANKATTVVVRGRSKPPAA